MFTPTDRVVVGLSGGKDSIVLTYLLNEIEKRFPNSELITLTIDEGITNYREESIEIATKITEKWGLTHKIYKFKDTFGHTIDEIGKIIKNKELDLLPCSFCGVFRRKLLNIAARELNADKLAVGFNLDDEAQTILMNLIRGDIGRLKRVSGETKKIHAKFIPRVRPLREIHEKEVMLYAYYKNLPIQSKECPYAFTSLRYNVRSAINLLEQKTPNVKYNLVKDMNIISDLLQESDSLQKKRVYECMSCGEPASTTTCKACEIKKLLD